MSDQWFGAGVTAAAGGPTAQRRSSSASSSQEPSQSPNHGFMKVPIPRLRRPSGPGDDGGGGNSGGNSGDKHRVSHACESCRQRKTKCSGERPVCKHCQDFKITCYYGDGKRDRAKNELMALKSKLKLYGDLLEQLSIQVDSAGRLAIQKALQGSSSPSGGVIQNQITENSRDGESLVTADVGSTGSMDHIRADVNVENSLYPTGYMGKSSEVSWIQRVAQQLAQEATEDSPNEFSPKSGEGIYRTEDSRTGSMSDMTKVPAEHPDLDTLQNEDHQFQMPIYHLDDLSVSIAGGQVDPFALPPKETADELLNAFFNTIHPTYPIVLKKLFMQQYDAFFQCFFPPDSLKRWLAMLNLMFAIGALYARLVDALWKGESEIDHLKYFARARILSLDEGCIFEVADLQQVQVVGLAGIYLVASNQTNRAWNVIGLAIRYAQTLGLNLRNDVPELDEIEKEMRVRMWYSLYSIEHLLCIITGRPSSIHDRDCSVFMPRPVDEEQFGSNESFEAALRRCSEVSGLLSSESSSRTNSSSATSSTVPSSTQASSSSVRTPISGQLPPLHPTFSISGPTSTYFIEHTKLNKITTEVLHRLYSPGTINRSWSDIQGIISALELKTVKWRADLPPLLDFGKRQRDQVFYRQRMCLAFQYYNTRIIINRPCLCRLDHRIPNESNRSRGFNRSAAAACIEAARESIALLPDEPNPIGLISISPWWCLLHFLVSSGAILMVEMVMRAEHNPQQADGLLKDAKKVVRWLRALAEGNLAAERSWAVLSKLLIVSAPKIGGDTSDVQRDPPSSRKSSKMSTGPRTMTGIHDSDGFGTGQIHVEHNRRSSGNASQPNQHQMQLDQNTTHVQAIPDLFRWLNHEPFPFGHIPIHTRFDGMLSPDETPSFVPVQGTSNYPEHAQSGYENQTSMMFPTPEQMRGITADMDRQSNEDRRRQARQQHGVNSISIPPPPFSSSHWIPTSPFTMNQPFSQHSSVGEPSAISPMYMGDSMIHMHIDIQRPHNGGDGSHDEGLGGSRK